MTSPPLDLEASPSPRTREENQERAFIAASRRKDRSLDARVESANRASALHKQRTGKALLITREIVEKEAMYEEIDDRYHEKLNRMIMSQNMQLQDHFQRNLLAALAMRPNQGIQQRRAASMTPRASVGGSGGIRKMSLDLSNVRSSISEGMTASPVTSPMGGGMDHSYMLSPTYDGNAQSPSYPEVVSASSAGPIPSYLHATHPTPTWQPHQQPALRSPWAGFQPPQISVPGDMGMAYRHQFRDRMGSAPVIPVNGLSTMTPTATTPGGAPAPRTMSHARVRSEPHGLPAGLTSPHHHHQVDMVPTEPLPTPDLCPTPSTPHSPTSMTTRTADVIGYDLGKEEVSFSSHEGLDPDYAEFSQFAFGLGNSNQLGEGEFKFDDLVTLDEFSVSA